MQVVGYKVFNKNMQSFYGDFFEENHLYKLNNSEEIKFGSGQTGNGFHFCSNMEDTLRYVDGMHEEICIARVIGTGKQVKYDDEYNGYYDMYAASEIYIEHIYTREEIIDYFYSCNNEFSIERFIKGYRLNNEEIELFKEKFSNFMNITKAIAYYQEGKKDAYSLKR